VQGLAATATCLLQRGSRLYGLDLGPTGSSWDWPVCLHGGFTGPLGLAGTN
jgi:hypothetical protein